VLLERRQSIVRCVLVLDQVKVLRGNRRAFPRVELSQRFLLTPELEILALPSGQYPFVRTATCASRPLDRRRQSLG
jgi:hypothetical protein